MVNGIKVLGATFIAATLVACGNPDGNSKAENSASTTAVELDKNGFPSFKREALLPLDKYVKINRSDRYEVPFGEATDKEIALYRSAYWSGAKQDYDLLAYDFLPEYRKEKDDFKRSDIVKANRDRLDAAYKDAHLNNHFALYFDKNNAASIGAYDAEKKGFPVYFNIKEVDAFMWAKPNEGREQYEKYWGFQIIGADYQFSPDFYIPKNEDEARRISATLSSLRQGSDQVTAPTTYIGHVAASDPKPGFNNPYAALFVLDGLAIHDPKSGEVIFTLALQPTSKLAGVKRTSVKEQFERASQSK